MKKRLIILPALLLAALTPAEAEEVFLYADRADGVHVNVFRPVGGAETQSSAPEVSMFFGKLDVIADPNEWGYPEEGGCVDIYHDGIIDSGCASLNVEPDGVMGTTRVHGTIDSWAYSYTAERGFEDLGPSQITVDLQVTGVDAPEVSPYSTYAVGVCGLPPSTEGVFVDARPELQRTAGMTGTLVSDAAGAVDPTTLPALLVQAFGVTVGACL